jgi:hypothetical protein
MICHSVRVLSVAAIAYNSESGLRGRSCFRMGIQRLFLHSKTALLWDAQCDFSGYSARVECCAGALLGEGVGGQLGAAQRPPNVRQHRHLPALQVCNISLPIHCNCTLVERM